MTIESQQPISASQATLMLGAILSDTVNLSSSTTTEHDIAAVKSLSAICQLNYDTFVEGLLAAKTDIHGLSADYLLMKDAKYYQIHGFSVLISQIELASMSAIEAILPEILAELAKQSQIGHFDIAVLVITDIFKQNSTIYFSQDNQLHFSSVSLLGAISRKKDILPWLTSTILISSQ